MAVPLYATPANLLASGLRPANVIAALADDENNPPDSGAAGTQLHLTEALEWASDKVHSRLWGRVDLTDEIAANKAKRLTMDLAMYKLYERRGNYGAANQFNEARREAMIELTELREAKQQTGTNAEPAVPAWSSTANTNPSYANAAENGGGTTPSFLQDF